MLDLHSSNRNLSFQSRQSKGRMGRFGKQLTEKVRTSTPSLIRRYLVLTFFWLIRKNAPLGYANREVRFFMESEFEILHIHKGCGTVRTEMHNNSELPLPYCNAILLSLPVCRNCIQVSLVYPAFCVIG